MISKPIFRWAGGKSWLTPIIDSFLPITFENYYEPFLGGAAIFLHLKSYDIIKGRSILSDSNPYLINAYRVIRDSPKELIEILKTYRNTKSEYYKIRSTKLKSNEENAAKFIYLNRTSFNGIYRENLNGEYNVPYGFKKYKLLFDFDSIFWISELLQNSELETKEFQDCLSNVKKNDFVFLDPPYTVAHENNGFIKYNQKIFSWEDQKRLSTVVRKLKNQQVHFVLTNAYHDCIRDLYSGISMPILLERNSLIGGKSAKRKVVHELIFSNNV